MFEISNNSTQTLATIGANAFGAAVDMDRVGIFSAQCNITVNTAAAGAFTAANATSLFTKTAHGLVTGEVVQVSNSGGALPTGLSAATNYYVILIDANTFKLATSLANAQAGTNLTISDNGTGTQTVTPTALASASVQLQKSNDGTNWANEGSATSVTATGVFFLEKTVVTSKWMRVAYVLASGSFKSTTVLCSISLVP